MTNKELDLKFENVREFATTDSPQFLMLEVLVEICRRLPEVCEVHMHVACEEN